MDLPQIKIDVTKIPKERLYIGEKGKYLTIRLVENRDGEDKFGNHGFVAIDISKEARDAGEKGEIIGNFKFWRKPAQQQRNAPPPRRQEPIDPSLDPLDDVPF